MDGVLVLYGSETGTAQDYAENIYLEATAKGYRVRLETLDDFQREFPTEERIIIILMSNTDDGDPPDNSSNFWQWINKVNDPEAFAGTSIALLGLKRDPGFGDSNYVNFNKTGYVLEKIFPQLGAKWLIPPAFCDADKGNDLVAEPWTKALRNALEVWFSNEKTKATAPTEAVTDDAMSSLNNKVESMNLEAPRKEYEFWKLPISEHIPEGALRNVPKLHSSTISVKFYEFPLVDKCASPTSPSKISLHEASRKYPIKATDILMHTLTSKDAIKPVVSVKFIVDDPRWYCEAGDSFALICENDPDTVDCLISRLYLGGETLVELSSVLPISSDGLIDLVGTGPITIKRLFMNFVDIMHFPKKSFIRHLAEFCENESEKFLMLYLSSKAGSADYMALASGHANIMDFLYTFPSCRPSLECVLSHLPALHPRFYSVCSSPNDPYVEFIYNPVDYLTPNGILRKGVCSSWLDRCRDLQQKGKKLEFSIFLRPSPHFRLPEDPSLPVIMICAGTGVSPFIGFLRSMREKQSKLAPLWLFYGFRNREQDFLFKDELYSLLTDGYMSKLSIATSREPESGHPKYVQDALWLHSGEIYKLMLSKPGARIYICGDELTMIKDVNMTIQRIISKEANVSEEEASSMFNDWNSDKRIVRDVWL